MSSDSDWIIFYGITTGYALGPFCSRPGGPFPYSLGQLTDHPQHAIGWVEKGDAERACTLCGGGGKVMLRSVAIAQWNHPEKGLGPTMGVIDWGTLR